MKTTTLVTTIAATPEKVWRELSDLESHAEWMSDAVDIEFTGSQRAGVGTKMKVLTKVGPLRTTDVLEITDWSEPTSITAHHLGRVAGWGRFEIAPTASGSTLTWIEALKFPWYLGGPLTAAIARPIFRRIWSANLARFSQRVTGL